MIHWFKKASDKNQAGVCLLQDGNSVFYQNAHCRKLCGTFTGRKCPQTCVLSCEETTGKSIEGEGVQLFRNIFLGKKQFDVLFLNAVPFRMVLLYPLSKKHNERIEQLQDKKMTRREFEIARLCIQGFTNTAIAEKIFISKATLKSHLNSIYRKTPNVFLGNNRKKPK